MAHGVANTFYCKFMFIIGLKIIAFHKVGKHAPFIELCLLDQILLWALSSAVIVNCNVVGTSL